MKHSIILCIILCIASSTSYSTIKINQNKIFKKSIKSVCLFNSENKTSFPIIDLNSNEELCLSFDDLTDENKTYNYRFFHCKSNWEKSNLSEFDYLEGFSNNEILDYDFSFNTIVSYVHYSFKFPNKDIKFKISGNYIIEVYDDFECENIVFRRRFMIKENLVNISGKIKKPINFKTRETDQQISIIVDHPNFNISNALSEIKLKICQNYRFDESSKFLKPDFIKNKKLVYDNPEIRFSGANEFFRFNTRSYKYIDRHIFKIEKEQDKIHALLNPISPNNTDNYFYEKDANGMFLHDTDFGDDPNIESDYIYVTFAYKSDIKDSDIYIAGYFNSYDKSSENKMIYDSDNKVYIKTMLLKQGYYEYMLHSNSRGSAIGSSFWQTQNLYNIFLYYYDYQLNTDRLIGYQNIDSSSFLY